MITPVNLTALINDKKNSPSNRDLIQSQEDRLSLLKKFKSTLDAAFNGLANSNTPGEGEVFDFLIGGSTPWQYINGLIHGTPFQSADTDLYAIPHLAYQAVVKKLKSHLMHKLTRELSLQQDKIYYSHYKDILHYELDANDYNLLSTVEIFANFQVFINEHGDIEYSATIPTHKEDFNKFILEHKIICYNLEGLLEGASQYASSAPGASTGAIKFGKLAFVLKSLYKPLAVGKIFDYGTAKFLHELLNDENHVRLVQLLSARMADKYPYAFVSPDNADSLIERIKSKAKNVISNASVEDKLQFAEKEASKYRALLHAAKTFSPEAKKDAEIDALQNELRLEANKLKRSKRATHDMVTKLDAATHQLVGKDRVIIDLQNQISRLYGFQEKAQQDISELSYAMSVLVQENSNLIIALNQEKSMNNQLKSQIFSLTEERNALSRTLKEQQTIATRFQASSSVPERAASLQLRNKKESRSDRTAAWAESASRVDAENKLVWTQLQSKQEMNLSSATSTPFTLTSPSAATASQSMPQRDHSMQDNHSLPNT